ncbi:MULTISPECIES: molybdopterin-guanine dinucleotide biosynthesis protein B [Pyrobaculum]|uniref:Molybdopterin-guanine dinucleotide biosynthesis protein B, conjectural n=2 Tax=Pyrobaculum aerophilum TaxID=13773 RepID=Q8ZWJ9_PYRAE|nr:MULTISPECIES: molybdopterin-guanine dinucleotide biosynthesis protein B [Pyrobaculum]AAL63703.1 molybdopterin-guanine dinucleotide biosynthesis protein B, conjectural [Pyrobaculum aerophilum str. IM2]MCX8137743.1 molybdopterin-guanine dinucleotide biosynthesis protein B [Pyrobaculum aerophilum]RFA96898.1 molybdopterin-guanine dinucleotide biosynthesis protein MobB [Pyrobaculum aerophilum]RFA98396.1 molybdopterin-guanine dinucleotide biosynthesis protein MobB [Pyrobaculum aerophilum]HII46345
MTCVIQITGMKDVGKTVLAEKIIAKLKEGGHSVVAVKVSHHEPDPPTKDTHRLRKAGADMVVFYNGVVYVVYKRELECAELDADFIVVEGLRGEKVGYKIHIGPDPPGDADVVITNPGDDVEIKCVEADPCEVLEALRRHHPLEKAPRA